MADDDLDETVKRLLASETFEVAELGEVLVQRGYGKAEVEAAIARAVGKLDDERQSSGYQNAVSHGRRGKRLVQLGVIWLLVGTGFSLYAGGGMLQWLLIIAIGAALIVAGRRGI